MMPLLSMSREKPIRLRQDPTSLRPELRWWMIFSITVAGVIGITVFSTTGMILRIAGPAGLLISTVFVSITMICAMECLGEFVIMWPVANAMVEYVKAFVDQDLAIVVGLAYWYTMSSVFATLIILAADFAKYWMESQMMRIIIFYALTPFALFLINSCGVKVYGYIEGVGGMLKILLVAAGVIFMAIDARKNGVRYINNGLVHDTTQARNNISAICMSIPLLSYGFIGVEIVSVTAFEAKDRNSLRKPVKWIPYFISAIYLICALLACFVVWWHNPRLPVINRRAEERILMARNSTGPGFDAVPHIAAEDYGSPAAAIFFDACIIYFCLSAANTSLYVASRTLFGLTRDLNHLKNPPWYIGIWRYLGRTSHSTEVPLFALAVSTLPVIWLAYPHEKGISAVLILDIFSTTSSICGILVWASQCVAFMRYHHWFHHFKKMRTLPDKYNRWTRPEGYGWHGYTMLMSSTYTIPAWISLVGCFLIVFIFSSANWWDRGHPGIRAVATAYGGSIVLFTIFVILKCINGWRRVVLDENLSTLLKVINNFEKNTQQKLGQSGPVELVEHLHIEEGVGVSK